MVEIEHIVIYGQPYVKKSNQKVGYNRRTGKRIKYDTPSYRIWHREALNQLSKLGYDTQFKKVNKALKEHNQPLRPAKISESVNMQCLFFMQTDGRCDLSALYEGIQDVLVEVGLLQDDNWHIVASHDGSGVCKDDQCPRMEITKSVDPISFNSRARS